MNERYIEEKGKNISSFKAELILLFATISWGLSFPLIKISLDYFDPVTFVLIRFGVSLIICIIILYKQVRLLTFKEIKYGLILGIFLFLGFITQTAGLKFTTASNSAFITGTNILLLPFIQVIIVKKKPKVENIIGIIISFIGLYYLTGIEHKPLNIGDLITFICAISFAFQIVLLDYYSQKTGFLPLLIGQFITMTILGFFSLSILHSILSEEIYIRLNPASVSLMLFNILFPTILSFILTIKFQKFTTPVKAGLIYNSEVFYAIVSSYFILNEILQTHQIIGGILIITGIIVSEFFGEIIKLKTK